MAVKVKRKSLILWWILALSVIFALAAFVSSRALSLDVRSFAKDKVCARLAQGECNQNNLCQWEAKGGKNEDCSYKDCSKGVSGCSFQTKPSGNKVCVGSKKGEASGQCVMRKGAAVELAKYCYWGKSGYKVEQGVTVVGANNKVYRCKGNNKFERVDTSADIKPKYMGDDGKCYRDGVVYRDGGVMYKNGKMQICKKGEPVDADSSCRFPNQNYCAGPGGKEVYITCDNYGQVEKESCGNKQACTPAEGCIDIE